MIQAPVWSGLFQPHLMTLGPRVLPQGPWLSSVEIPDGRSLRYECLWR